MPLTLGVPLGYTVPLGVNSQILSRRLSGIPVLTPGEYPRSPPRGSLRVAHQQWCASLRTRLHRSQDYPKKFPKGSKKVSKTSLLRRIFGAYKVLAACTPTFGTLPSDKVPEKFRLTPKQAQKLEEIAQEPIIDIDPKVLSEH